MLENDDTAEVRECLSEYKLEYRSRWQVHCGTPLVQANAHLHAQDGHANWLTYGMAYISPL